jgi:glutamate formiminotransferase/formiminotetrahydrofolate cyclodeaminase
MEDAAAWYLQLDDFERQQVLERRMQGARGEAAEAAEQNAFLDALASSAPTPGGGSAAAHAGAVAAALVAMVARLTIGKKKYADVENQMNELAQKADALRAKFVAAVSADAQAFDAVMAAMKLPKESDAEKATRQTAIDAATLRATRQPLDVARMAVETLGLAREAAQLGNTNAISDAGTGAAMANAALAGAALNVRINAHALGENKEAASLLKELQTLEKEAAKIEEQVRAQIKERGGFDVV